MVGFVQFQKGLRFISSKLQYYLCYRAAHYFRTSSCNLELFSFIPWRHSLVLSWSELHWYVLVSSEGVRVRALAANTVCMLVLSMLVLSYPMVWKTKMKGIFLETWDALQKRMGCNFCQLVVGAIVVAHEENQNSEINQEQQIRILLFPGEQSLWPSYPSRVGARLAFVAQKSQHVKVWTCWMEWPGLNSPSRNYHLSSIAAKLTHIEAYAGVPQYLSIVEKRSSERALVE